MENLVTVAVLLAALFILVYHRKDKRVLRFAIFVIGVILFRWLHAPLTGALKTAASLPVVVG